MRIEIYPETDAEKALVKEPIVLTGCIRFGLAGMDDRTEKSPTGEFDQLHAVLPGDNLRIHGDLARLAANLDLMAMQQTTVNGVLHAHNLLAKAQNDAAILSGLDDEVLRNGKPLRIHRG